MALKTLAQLNPLAIPEPNSPVMITWSWVFWAFPSLSSLPPQSKSLSPLVKSTSANTLPVHSYVSASVTVTAHQSILISACRLGCDSATSLPLQS